MKHFLRKKLLKFYLIRYLDDYQKDIWNQYIGGEIIFKKIEHGLGNKRNEKWN
jgi:hypothetical protein